MEEKCEEENYGRRKKKAAPFLVKTWKMVEDEGSDGVISWNEGGWGFVVWQPIQLARDLLPTLFKHSNFSSFLRQLHTYGFKKVTMSRWEFSNNMFQRGKRELLSQIRRRKTWPRRQSPPIKAVSPVAATLKEPRAPPQTRDKVRRSTSTSSSSLVDENKRLKKENGVLIFELTTMKQKCKELLELVAFYTSQKEERALTKDDNDDDEKHWPKLFGVRLDVGKEARKSKRSREIYETSTLLLS